ncbi:60S ribosomal protein L5, partial [Coemansia sp. RSA 2706]
LGLADKYQGFPEIDGSVQEVEAIEDGPRPFKAFLDVGLKRTTTGSKVFAAMKGASDGGVFVPHSESRFPGYDTESKELDGDTLRDYIFGGHIAEYMRSLKEEDEERYNAQFSRFIKAGISADDLEGIYTSAHKAIRADPSFTPTEKKADAKPRRLQTPLNAKQRKDRVRQKIEAFKRAQEQQ